MRNKFCLVITAIAAVNIMASCENTTIPADSTTAFVDKTTTLIDSSTDITTQQTMSINENYDDEEVIFDSDSKFVSKLDEEAINNYENNLFKNGLLCVTDEETGKYGYINPNGEIEIGVYFDAAMDFSPNGLAAVGFGEHGEEKFGFIDDWGNYVISPQFDYVSNFGFDGIAIAGEISDGWKFKYGYIDEHGDYVIEPKYYAYLSEPPFTMFASMGFNNLNEYKFAKNGLAVATSDDTVFNAKYGYINMDGDFVIDPQYDIAKPFDSYGYAVVGTKVDGVINYGIIDEKGTYVIESQFYSISDFDKNGLAIVGIAEKYNSTNDNWKIPNEVKYGFINRLGDFVIDPIFTEVESFADNGLALVNAGSLLDRLYGYIDKSGNYVIEPTYEYAASFSNGVACVSINGKKGYINEKNEFMLKPKFGSLSSMSLCGLALASDKSWGGYNGYINIDGEYIVEPIFDDAYPFYNDGYTVGYWRYIEDVATCRTAYEFSLVNSEGELISIGSLHPCRWRFW